MYSEEITLEGHIIDSLILPNVWDTVMDMGGEYDLVEMNPSKLSPHRLHRMVIASS